MQNDLGKKPSLSGIASKNISLKMMNIETGSPNRKNDSLHIFFMSLFYVLVFSIALYLFSVQAFSYVKIAEFNSHVTLTKIVAAEPFGFTVPHPGFHLMILALSKISGMDVTYSGIIVLSIFVVIIAFMIISTLISLLTEYYSKEQIPWMGAGLLLIFSIYFPPISKYYYLG